MRPSQLRLLATTSKRLFPSSSVPSTAIYQHVQSFSTSSSSSPSSSNITPVTTAASTVIAKPQNTLKSSWKAFSELTKLRLSSLVVVTTGAGYLFAGGPIDIPTMAYACLGTGMCAASASTFNEIIEVNADKAMNRTKSRPIPSGKITKTEATVIGTTAGIGGTALLYFMTNPVVAALGFGNILLYSGIYTYSKRITELNTWIGSIVGAIPPIMGYAAATQGQIFSNVDPYIIGSLLFLWQFPHFFALSWLHREDYARGGFQMVPVNDPTGYRTAKLIQEYSIYLTLLPIVTTGLGYTSSMFLLEGTAVNIYLLHLSKKFSDERTNANARRLFLTSLWYLPAILFGLVFYSKNWNKEQITNKEKLENGLLESGEEKELDPISKGLLSAKETLKGLCVHEMITQKEENAPHLCIKKASDKTIDSTVEIIEQAKSEITTVEFKKESNP